MTGVALSMGACVSVGFNGDKVCAGDPSGGLWLGSTGRGAEFSFPGSRSLCVASCPLTSAGAG